IRRHAGGHVLIECGGVVRDPGRAGDGRTAGQHMVGGWAGRRVAASPGQFPDAPVCRASATPVCSCCLVLPARWATSTRNCLPASSAPSIVPGCPPRRTAAARCLVSSTNEFWELAVWQASGGVAAGG